MTDDRIPPTLERRIASSLHAAAPHPAPDLADRVLRRTAATGQRRRWSGRAFASAMAAAAVVVAVVVIGLQLGGVLPDRNIGGEPSTVAATPSPSASTPSASEPPPSNSPAPSAGIFRGGQTCANEEFGFTVGYPDEWWANEAVVPDDPALTPIPACMYFAEEPVELQPNAGLPGGITVIVDLAEEPGGGEPTGVVVVERRETVVDGRPAVVEELEWSEDTVFQRAGDRTYAYRISLSAGETLVLSTDTYVSGADAATYATHKDVLDRMMDGLTFTRP